MLEILTAQGATIKLCKTCTNARGITELPLADWTIEADKVLNF